MSGAAETLQRHRVDLALGIGVAVVGIGEIWNSSVGYASYQIWPLLLIALGMALATGLARPAPGSALLVVWVTCGFQVAAGADILLVQLMVGLVAYGTARHGSVGVLWASGLSIPIAALIGLVYVRDHGWRLFEWLGYRDVFASFDVYLLLLMAAIGTSLLAVPWLLGLLLRARAAARTSHEGQVAAEQDAARAMVATQQAEEIATLRAGQARLARDVHDVVGHSLAVVLAQAEAARLLPEDQPERVQEALANIADTARKSLGEIREVLSSTGDGATGGGARVGELDTLVEGIRAAGNDVRASVVGRPQPLPPELAVVAFRVLQEMLTNAIKHGRRGAPVHVEQHWEGELRIEVHNLVDDLPDTAPVRPTGLGVDGMTRRLESVGGRLDVRRRQEDGVGETWTATAWVPIRADAL